MANLTIAIDDDLLKQARIRAIEEGTSVNAVLRDYLTRYAGQRESRKKTIKHLLGLSARSTAGRGGRRWSRDELHER